MVVAAIIDPAKAAHAQVLAASLERHMPGTRLTVLLVGDETGAFQRGLAAMDVRRPDQLDGSHCGALKPLFLRSLLEDDEPVILLDAEVELFAGLDEMAELAHERGIVLVPSALEPIPLDGLSPTEPDLQALGIYNAGCLAVGKAAGEFLDWHEAHLLARSEQDLAGGTSLDERWLDFVPAYFDHQVVRDPGIGVGSWNLHERHVVDQDGQQLVNGMPLRLFNFRGFDPDQPSLLTTHRFHSGLPLRADLRDEPAVVRLREAYARSLRQ